MLPEKEWWLSYQTQGSSSLGFHFFLVGCWHQMSKCCVHTVSRHASAHSILWFPSSVIIFSANNYGELSLSERNAETNILLINQESNI